MIASFIITTSLIDKISALQKDDHFIQKIRGIIQQGEPSSFQVDNEGILRLKGRICVPNIAELRKEVLDECHKSKLSIHPGVSKMYNDIKRTFWWKSMKRDISLYVSRCPTCQLVKSDQQKLARLLQPLDVPGWKWEHISMDFINGLPRTRKGNDSIWVIVDRFTKTAHFIPVRSSRTAQSLAQIYFKEIVKLHGIPISIVSDRDPIFASKF